MSIDALGHFVGQAERASSTVHEIPDWEGVAAHLAWRAGTGRVAVSPSLAAEGAGLTGGLAERTIDVLVPDDDDAPHTVADVEVGVVRGVLAVAESGSVLVAEHALADRLVSMLCRRLVQVVDRDAIVPRLEDAAQWLAARGGQAGFASLLTGPSRTADIERSLTIGVQGPDAVDVVMIG